MPGKGGPRGRQTVAALAPLGLSHHPRTRLMPIVGAMALLVVMFSSAGSAHAAQASTGGPVAGGTSSVSASSWGSRSYRIGSSNSAWSSRPALGSWAGDLTGEAGETATPTPEPTADSEPATPEPIVTVTATATATETATATATATETASAAPDPAEEKWKANVQYGLLVLIVGVGFLVLLLAVHVVGSWGRRGD